MLLPDWALAPDCAPDWPAPDWALVPDCAEPDWPEPCAWASWVPLAIGSAETAAAKPTAATVPQIMASILIYIPPAGAFSPRNNSLAVSRFRCGAQFCDERMFIEAGIAARKHPRMPDRAAIK